MFENLIPSSYAASTFGQAQKTAKAGANMAENKAQSGLDDLVDFVIKNIDNWIAGIILVVISWIVAKMLAGAIKREIIKKKGDDVEESVLILVERITTIVILTVGITIAAAINGLNFTAVLGALSLGIGFALKDIIGNFISGIIMLSQDRVNIGDFIIVKEILGTIVSIDTRATILQGIDGTEVVIPNQSMLNETLISYSTNPFRRIELVVGVDYNTNLPMVTTLVKGIMDKDKHIIPKPQSQVLVDEFGDSAINLTIRFWIDSHDNWVEIRSNLANKIKKAFDEVNVNIPFPIRTLKLDENDKAFLATMDSMKKGIVPGDAEIPSKEKITETASATENEAEIPYKLFKEEKAQVIDGQVIPPPAKPKNTAESPDNAVGGAHAGLEQVRKVSPEDEKVENKQSEKAVASSTPPPTHM